MEGITSPPDAQINNTSSILSPLLISMLGIIVTSLAIVVYHFFLVKYCIRWHETTNTVAQPIPAAPPTTGVEKNVLDTIPILVFSRNKFELDQEECVVCLGELEDDDVVRLLPDCKHAFHVSCIDQWFVTHMSCPHCRSPILLQVKGKDEELSATSTRTNSFDRENVVSDAIYGNELSSPVGLLRHCTSLDLPGMENKSSLLITGFKRSLSMDQSFVVINLQKENETINCSSTSSSGGKLRTTESSRTRSLGHLDRVSSKLLSSFSRLRVGKGNVPPILPY